MSRKESKRERDNRKRHERAQRREQRKQRDLAIVGRRSDDERREHMRRIDDRSPLKPNVGDLLGGTAALREFARIRRERERDSA